jgi:hypothetical protein
MSDEAQCDVTTCSFLEELGKVLGGLMDYLEMMAAGRKLIDKHGLHDWGFDVQTLCRKPDLTAREACVATRTARQYTRRFTDRELLREEQAFPPTSINGRGAKLRMWKG